MKKSFLIYYNNHIMVNKYAENLAKTIFELGLKKGDNVTCYPFNFFKDEKTIVANRYKCNSQADLEFLLFNGRVGSIFTTINNR